MQGGGGILILPTGVGAAQLAAEGGDQLPGHERTGGGQEGRSDRLENGGGVEGWEVVGVGVEVAWIRGVWHAHGCVVVFVVLISSYRSCSSVMDGW